MKIVVAGGTGFIGRPLVERLISGNNHVVLLTRNPERVHKNKKELFQIAHWDGKNTGNLSKIIDGTDAVINLSGENVSAKRWTRVQKIKLLNSRIEPTRALVNAISETERKPHLLINASAAGYYGNYGPEDVTENSPKGDGFLADLCAQWEHEALCAEKYGLRVVLLRIGVVLEVSGGALKKMLLPFKFFAGGHLGSGEQWLSWIHRDDLINIICFALLNESISGPVNVVSPSPVTMAVFASSLGKALKRPSWLPVPSFVLKLALGEMSEMLVGGRKILPQKLLDNNFLFRYPDLDETLSSMGI